MGVAGRHRALARPADRDPVLLADPEGERAADGDGEHRGEVADHRNQAKLLVVGRNAAAPATDFGIWSVQVDGSVLTERSEGIIQHSRLVPRGAGERSEAVA